MQNELRNTHGIDDMNEFEFNYDMNKNLLQ